jgi:cytochrome c553
VSKNPLRGVADSGKTLPDRLKAGITTWPEGLGEETTLTIKSFGLALGLAIVCMPLAAAAQSGGSDDIDLASAAQLFKNNCSACHGKKAQGVASYPKLAGQDAAYLASKLQTYRAGEMVGPNSVLMIQNAKDLSPTYQRRLKSNRTSALVFRVKPGWESGVWSKFSTQGR